MEYEYEYELSGEVYIPRAGGVNKGAKSIDSESTA